MTREEIISLLTEWEQYKKAHCTESDGIDIDKLNMYQFATIKSRLLPAEGAEHKERSCYTCRYNPAMCTKTFDECAGKGYAAYQPQPTAEGAEEILTKHLGSLMPLKYGVKYNKMIDAMREFATLHAQRIAEKMVEERCKKCKHKGLPNSIQEALNSGDGVYRP